MCEWSFKTTDGALLRAPKRCSRSGELGLIAMRDRAELLDGQLQLFSETGRGVPRGDYDSLSRACYRFNFTRGAGKR